jgi:hypothetical protein
MLWILKLNESWGFDEAELFWLYLSLYNVLLKRFLSEIGAI